MLLSLPGTWLCSYLKIIYWLPLHYDFILHSGDETKNIYLIKFNLNLSLDQHPYKHTIHSLYSLLNFSTLKPTVGTISVDFSSSDLKWFITVDFPLLFKPTTKIFTSLFLNPRRFTSLSQNPIGKQQGSAAINNTFRTRKYVITLWFEPVF